MGSLLVVASAAQLRQVAIIDIPGRPGFDAMAWAEGKLVIAHTGADKVDVFDPAKRRVIAQIGDMKGPRGIAVDADAGKVYIANSGANSLAVIDSKTWSVVNPIALSASPNALLLTPGGRLYVSQWRNAAVAVVDLAKGGEVAKVELGGIPEQMVWDAEQRGVLISVQDQATVALIGADNQVSKRFKLAASQPTGLALDAKQRHLYVAVRFAVLVLNADTGAELARIPSAGGTDSLWFDESKNTLYAADSSGSVNMIATDNRQFVSEHELKTDVKGHTLAFDPEKKMVYMPGGREGRSKLVILKRVENPAAPAINAKDGAASQGAKNQTTQATVTKR
ncbi:MAG: hypothetical protein HYX28_01665 [Candidatus Koribacter versatilis]|uniref:YncE family protein n=1 Tax=Candidatus Korobacter versatilis TaxID=658062 RepID=A0A932A8G4_9BACT|nr:hypothetical protein [Candidatus Koribacter versatilis]